MAITGPWLGDGARKSIELTKECGISYITGVEVECHLPAIKRQTGFPDFWVTDLILQTSRWSKTPYNACPSRATRPGNPRKINAEFKREDKPWFTAQDMQNIKDSVDGAFGRPHIANYMVKKGIVQDIQAAFDRYLVKCDVPKYPLSLSECSTTDSSGRRCYRPGARQRPRRYFLATITKDPRQQTRIIAGNMLEYIGRSGGLAPQAWWCDDSSLSEIYARASSDLHRRQWLPPEANHYGLGERAGMGGGTIRD